MRHYTEQDIQNFVATNFANHSNEAHVIFSIFAESISVANTYTRNNWAATFDGAALRLNVGHYIICTLEHPQSLWLALDRYNCSHPHTAQEMINSHWKQDDPADRGTYPEYLDRFNKKMSVNGTYLLPTSLVQSWPDVSKEKDWLRVRFLHHALIHRITVIGKPLTSRTHRSHTPSVLVYLRNRLNQHIPDPYYQ